MPRRDWPDLRESAMARFIVLGLPPAGRSYRDDSLFGRRKICGKCGIPKEGTEFYPRSDSKGLRHSCKTCDADANKRRRLDNPEYFQAQSAKYYWEDPKKRNAVRTVSANKQYQEDLNFKIRANLRSRMLSAVKADGTIKSAKTEELLGCPVTEFIGHLESLFKPEMTWENHGLVWHIDHVRPCASFDLTDPEQQKACFNWTNQQPLFKEDNLRKAAKYDPLNV